MKKILLNGVDGNFGGIAAQILLDKYSHEDLVFCAPKEAGLKKYQDKVETRVADFNNPDSLEEAFSGVDTVILISMPFIGEKRQKAHQSAIDAAVQANVNRIVYTSIVGAVHKDIDTYEDNDHIFTENYIKKAPIHYVILRNSQYAEAMVSIFLDSYENAKGILANNMGDGKMAHISRNDCALAASMAAISDIEDKILEINGHDLLTISEFLDIASKTTGKKVTYQYIDDEQQYAFFDSIGVPRTTEQMWADTAKNFPYCSEGMVTFGRAIRLNQMNTYTDDFEKLTGKRPLSVQEIFEDIDNHLVGSRTSTDD